MEGIRMEKSNYAIYYNVFNERCEFFIEANSIEEALGIFFMEKHDICYHDVIDHMEV